MPPSSRSKRPDFRADTRGTLPAERAGPLTVRHEIDAAPGPVTMRRYMDALDPEGRAELVGRYGRIVAALAPELGRRPLVLPDGKHFPDAFTGDEASVERFLARMAEHAGLSDVPLRVTLKGESCGAGGCGTGGCAPGDPQEPDRVELGEQAGGYRLSLPASLGTKPIALAAVLAHTLGRVALAELLPEGEAPESPEGVTAELAAVSLGLGALLLEGSHLVSRGCGGARVDRLTELAPEPLALATALFAAAGGHRFGPLLRELSGPQASLVRDARAWVEASPELVDALRREPLAVGAGVHTLQEPRSLLARLLPRRRPAAAPQSLPPRRERTAEERQLAALVEEALAGGADPGR